MAEVFYYDYVTIQPWTYFLTASRFGLTYVGLKGDESVSPIFSFYPHRMLVHDPEKLAPYVKQLKEYFAGTRKEFDVQKNLTFLLIFRNLVPNFKEKRYNLYRLSHMALQPTMVISQHRYQMLQHVQ